MLVKLELIYSVRLNAHSIASSMNTHSRQESEFATVFLFSTATHTWEGGQPSSSSTFQWWDRQDSQDRARELCVVKQRTTQCQCRMSLAWSRSLQHMWENYKSSKSSHNSQSKWARYRENWNIQTVAKLILFYFLHFNEYREKKIKSAMKLLFRLINYLFFFFYYYFFVV